MRASRAKDGTRVIRQHEYSRAAPPPGIGFLRILPLLVLFLLITPSLRADTVILKDGTLLVGKIRKEGENTIIHSSAFGSFTIESKQVSKAYVTASYEEDILIRKKLGLPVDEDIINNIRENYTKGESNMAKARKEEAEKKTREKSGNESSKDTGNLWVNGRISLSGSIFYNPGRLSPVIPYGFAGHLAIDQGLDMILKKRNLFWPGLRIETGYHDNRQGGAKLTGFTVSAGFGWALPSMKNSWGNCFLALLPGIAILDIEKGSNRYKGRSVTFTAQAILGYQYSWKLVTLFLHFRYLYFYDRDVVFNGIGGELGIGFNAW